MGEGRDLRLPHAQGRRVPVRQQYRRSGTPVFIVEAHSVALEVGHRTDTVDSWQAIVKSQEAPASGARAFHRRPDELT